MKKKIVFLFWFLFAVLPTLLAQKGKIQNTEGQLIGTTKNIHDFTKNPSRLNIPIRDKKGLFWNRGIRKNPVIHWDKYAHRFKEDPLRKNNLSQKKPQGIVNIPV